MQLSVPAKTFSHTGSRVDFKIITMGHWEAVAECLTCGLYIVGAWNPELEDEMGITLVDAMDAVRAELDRTLCLPTEIG